MGYVRLRRRQIWSAGASEARPRFGSLGPESRHSQSAVAAALCRRTPKVPRVAYPSDSSVYECSFTYESSDRPAGFGVLARKGTSQAPVLFAQSAGAFDWLSFGAKAPEDWRSP